MTNSTELREAFERIVRLTHKLDGPWLRDCNDIEPERTYQDPATEGAWELFKQATHPSPVSVAGEREAFERYMDAMFGNEQHNDWYRTHPGYWTTWQAARTSPGVVGEEEAVEMLEEAWELNQSSYEHPCKCGHDELACRHCAISMRAQRLFKKARDALAHRSLGNTQVENDRLNKEATESAREWFMFLNKIAPSMALAFEEEAPTMDELANIINARFNSFLVSPAEITAMREENVRLKDALLVAQAEIGEHEGVGCKCTIFDDGSKQVLEIIGAALQTSRGVK